jgi:hypothetical protein
MSFHFRFEGHDVDIDDVPLARYAEIEKETGTRWFQLQRSPFQHAAAGEMLAKACADIAGVELPPLTPRLFVDVFELVEAENRPTEFEEGVPDPKAEGSDLATI